MYDYNATHDCWLLIGGAPGSDTAYDGCWIIERNPNYPATQPEPWRIRNFSVTGKAEANYVPRYQARNLAASAETGFTSSGAGSRRGRASQTRRPQESQKPHTIGQTRPIGSMS